MELEIAKAYTMLSIIQYTVLNILPLLLCSVKKNMPLKGRQ